MNQCFEYEADAVCDPKDGDMNCCAKLVADGSTCAPGQGGCKDDDECAAGSSCIPNNGDKFGARREMNVCDHDLSALTRQFNAGKRCLKWSDEVSVGGGDDEWTTGDMDKGYVVPKKTEDSGAQKTTDKSTTVMETDQHDPDAEVGKTDAGSSELFKGEEKHLASFEEERIALSMQKSFILQNLKQYPYAMILGVAFVIGAYFTIQSKQKHDTFQQTLLVEEI